MNDTKYLIASDDRKCLLRIRMIGFWDAADVAAFSRDEQAAAAALPCGHGQHLVLADLSDFKLQSQEVVAQCERFIRSASLQSKRLALVGGDGLAWMQIKRMMVRDRIAAFEDLNIAERWLLTGDNALSECVHRRFAAKAAVAAASISCPGSSSRSGEDQTQSAF